MKKTGIAIVLGLVMAMAGAALADPSAEVKAAKGIENRDPVGEGTSFQKGDTVFVWSIVADAAGTTVKHIWKKDGKEYRTATFPVKGKKWRMSSKQRGAQPGTYVVEVVTGSGTKLGEASFTVN
jgi:hypothetical protein